MKAAVVWIMAAVFLFVAAVLLLMGCAGPVYILRPEQSVEEYKRIVWKCNVEATNFTKEPLLNWLKGVPPPFELCMELHGYQKKSE